MEAPGNGRATNKAYTMKAFRWKSENKAPDKTAGAERVLAPWPGKARSAGCIEPPGYIVPVAKRSPPLPQHRASFHAFRRDPATQWGFTSRSSIFLGRIDPRV